MKLSPNNLLSEEDYLSKRNELVIERDNAKSNLDKLDKKTDEWDDLTVKTFDFAARAKEKFENGDLLTKQAIIRGVGSYLTLSGSKLGISPRNPFIRIKEELNLFVPEDMPVISENIDPLSPQILHWGGIPDSNRRPPLPQSGALPTELIPPQTPILYLKSGES